MTTVCPSNPTVENTPVTVYPSDGSLITNSLFDFLLVVVDQMDLEALNVKSFGFSG